jgi:hypothetical protein
MTDFIGPYLFLKFGEQEHLKDLQQQGHLYFNALKYFTEVEDGNVRGDIDETLFYSKIKLHSLRNKNFSNGIIKVNNVPGLLKFRAELGNIFCLYSIDTRKYNKSFKYKFDKLMDGFDKFSLLITDVPEFLKRVEQALIRQNLKNEKGPVKYYDLKKYVEDKGPFIKDIAYEYQKEYRIVIYKETVLPTSIFIGNIEDISILSDKCASELDIEFFYSK